MASVDYLNSGETPTAARMNALWGTFDTKLSTLLGGRSPILAFQGVIPIDLLGKCFFFCHATQPAKYAYRVPQARLKSGTIIYDGGLSDAVLWSYDHTVFTNAAAGITNLTYDEGTSIVLVDRIPASSYGTGLGVVGGVSIFDHSLQVHKHTRPSDGKVFFLEERTVASAERRYKYALAELILDGVTQVTIPDTYDKYLCFRIHNLNNSNQPAAKVTFGTTEVTIPPLGCAVVRRDRKTDGTGFENYRLKTGYFFDFERGDFRHFWVDPLNAQPIEKPSTHMRANNLSCPSIVYDWIAAMGRKISASGRPGGAIPATFAWFYIDPHQVKDEYSKYSTLLGNPSDPGTRLGDLIWHKGPLLVGKVHKTNKLPPPNETLPDIELTEFEFKGLETIVADFAAVGIDVTNGPGNALRFRMSAASAVNYSEFILVPYGTNLFKDAQGGMRAAYQLTAATGPTLDNSFFDIHVEDGEGFFPALSTTAPQLLTVRTFAGTVNQKTWRDFSVTPAVTRTVVGEPYLAITTRVPDGLTGATTITDLQNHTVAELLSLSPFRDTSLSIGPVLGTLPLTFYTNAQLILTPFGLRLIFKEQMSAAILGTPFSGGVAMNDFSNHPHEAYLLQQGRYKIGDGLVYRNRAIKFRGHGFPWVEREIFPPQATVPARSTAMFLSPRFGRRISSVLWHERDQYATPLVVGLPGLDSIGSSGEQDYNARLPKSSENGVKVLLQTKRANLAQPAAGGRFWMPKPQDALNWFWAQKAAGDAGLKVALATHKATLYAGGSPGDNPDYVYPLLSEHYNGMAMAVNQLTEGKGLDYKALRFIVLIPGTGARSTAIRRNAAYTGLPEGESAGHPIPIDAWDFTSTLVPGSDGNTMFLLYAQAGIPIRTVDQVPGFNDMLSVRNVDRVIDNGINVTISGSTFVREGSGPPFSGKWHGSAVMECFANVTYQNTPDGDPGGGTGRCFFYDGMGGGQNQGFGNLSTVYANFRWVKTSDVLTWLSGFGLPVLPTGFDEVFVPLELRVLKSSRNMVDGQFHSPVMGGFPIEVEDADLDGNGLGLDTPNGTYTARPLGPARHQYIEMLAFAPARTAALAKWKAQARTRTVRNIQWWDDSQPMFFLFQGIGAFVNRQLFTPQFGGASGVSPGVNRFVSENGPNFHKEWVPDEDEADDHNLLMQLQLGLITKLAVRCGSGNEGTRPNVGYVFRPFWMPKKDEVHNTIARAIRPTAIPWGGVNAWYPDNRTTGSADKFEWVFIGSSEPTPPMTPLQPGINILHDSNGALRDRFHVHFGDKEMGLIAL